MTGGNVEVIQSPLPLQEVQGFQPESGFLSGLGSWVKSLGGQLAWTQAFWKFQKTPGMGE